MKKYSGVIGTNKQGSDCEFEFFVDDNATEEEIEKVAQETAFDLINFYYEIAEG